MYSTYAKTGALFTGLLTVGTLAYYYYYDGKSPLSTEKEEKTTEN
jgi:hypothetical protein